MKISYWSDLSYSESQLGKGDSLFFFFSSKSRLLIFFISFCSNRYFMAGGEIIVARDERLVERSGENLFFLFLYLFIYYYYYFNSFIIIFINKSHHRPTHPFVLNILYLFLISHHTIIKYDTWRGHRVYVIHTTFKSSNHAYGHPTIKLLTWLA